MYEVLSFKEMQIYRHCFLQKRVAQIITYGMVLSNRARKMRLQLHLTWADCLFQMQNGSMRRARTFSSICASYASFMSCCCILFFI